MDLNEQPTKRPMTSEEVLSVFQQLQRLDIECFGRPLPSELIQFDTAIADLYFELDSLGAPFTVRKGTWKTMTKFFDASIPYRTWKSVVRPEKKRTVRELCELIASEAVMEDIRPLSILGRECLPAGAFLAVRNVLAEEGADVSDLRPSTRLEPLLKQHGDFFTWKMFKLAPGRLPRLQTKMHRFQLAASYLVGVSVLLMAIGTPMLIFDVGGATPIFFGGMVTMVPALLSTYATSSLPPREARLGEMQTVRDLCYAIVQNQ